MTTASPVPVARTRQELTEALAAVRRPGPFHQGGMASDRFQPSGPAVALVPTMGALHDGHLALIRTAREHAGQVVVSIFVNPLQFGPGEDFERYPRSFDADLEACRKEGVDLVFAPPHEVIYPTEPVIRVSAGDMGRRWEGQSRPSHFDGVLTVVLKLFQLVRPDVSVFGHKDAQQLALIRRMVDDLDLGVEVVAGSIVRAPDGLAISSRNEYLTARQRDEALALPRALQAGARRASDGADAIRRAALSVLSTRSGVDLDYLALVDPEDFVEISPAYAGPAVLAVAARVGSTRLIDNVHLSVRAHEE